MILTAIGHRRTVWCPLELVFRHALVDAVLNNSIDSVSITGLFETTLLIYALSGCGCFLFQPRTFLVHFAG
jgi:hypothetical protein